MFPSKFIHTPNINILVAKVYVQVLSSVKTSAFNHVKVVFAPVARSSIIILIFANSLIFTDQNVVNETEFSLLTRKEVKELPLT